METQVIVKVIVWMCQGIIRIDIHKTLIMQGTLYTFSFSVEHTKSPRTRHYLLSSGALRSSKSPHKLFYVFLGTFAIIWS